MTVQEQTTEGVVLTEGAALKVKNLLDQEGRDDLALRVAVQPGGCSGLRYQLFFDERSLDGDIVQDFGGVNVVVDRMSAPYVEGATIDFVDTIEK
ncbi:MAG: HesB/IscA family protein, partial [Jiangellaceae bacterium]